MSEVTISYSPSTDGWTSRWSYVPDWMMGMGSNFYTWKNGEPYKHDSNATRNNFYGVNYPSKITTIFNKDPLTTKVFKTVSLDSTSPWDTVVFSDLESGGVDSNYYQDKEGDWFAHIRRDSGIIDLRSLSTQGIGGLLSITGSILTFGFKIGTALSDGDSVYKAVAGSLVVIGTVSSHTATTITMAGLINAPVAGDKIVFSKNSQAESYGVRGYYMEIELTNDETVDVELFSLSSNVFKSNP